MTRPRLPSSGSWLTGRDGLASRLLMGEALGWLGDGLADAFAVAAEHSPGCPRCGVWMLAPPGCWYCDRCDAEYPRATAAHG